MPSAAGPEVPGQPQSSVVELPPLLFVRPLRCSTACNPGSYGGIRFTTDVATERFAAALSIRDVTDPAREMPVSPTSPVRQTPYDVWDAHAVEDAGFERQPPVHTWRYRIDPGLESADGQVLGYPWIGTVENWHEPAFTSFGDGHGVWETSGGAHLPFSARNFASVRQSMARLDAGDLMPRLLDLQRRSFAPLPPGDGTVRRLGVTPDQVQSHGIDISRLVSNGHGIVWLGLDNGQPIPQARAVSQPDHSAVVQVTNLGITVKDSPQSTLLFVTRLDNGDPVAGARVALVNRQNAELWHGTTNRDGIAMAPALPLRPPGNRAPVDTSEDAWRIADFWFLATAQKDGDLAYAASDWNEGIEPWTFGLGYDLWEATDILRGSVFTDRYLYRAGEDVRVKAVLRSDTPTGVKLLASGATLDVRVRDSRNREVDRRSVTVNRWSSAEWNWTIPSEATLGNYSIEVMPAGTEKPEGNDLTARPPDGDWLKRVQGSFVVAAYRRPDFRVETTVTAQPPVAGTTLRAVVDAHYLFGGAMNGRTARWTMTRSAAYGVPQPIRDRWAPDRFVFGYYPNHEGAAFGKVATDTATLDRDGHLTVTTPSATDVDYASSYTFEADVEDVSRQHIANRAGVVVYPAPWYVGLSRPKYFVDTRTGVDIDVLAADLQGAAVADLPVTLSLVRVQWNSIRRAEGSGFYTWETERIEVPSGEWQVTTMAAPVTLHLPVPQGGSYILSATAHDAAGHRTTTRASFYGIGEGYTAWERYDHNRITLEPEKASYAPGDSARVMIQSPWESATALLTVEREGIRRYQRFTLTSTQQTVSVPLTEADIPNVYVSVLLVRGRTSGEIGSDGDDPGRPAFRLGYVQLVVDDSSKQLQVAVSADRAEYRPANTAAVSVTVKDAAGRGARSEVTLWAVDYGVLSLTGYQAPDVLHAVYRYKSLQVSTEDSRERIVSRRVLTPKGATEGGGGGRENGADVRRDFRPLAFWLGSVETDGQGRATRQVTLPESLTTYRIMAVAGDLQSRFGSAAAEIRVSKPVTLLAAFPRFLTIGDRASFGGTVSNTLAAGGDASITVESLDPAILQFGGDTTRTIRLEAGSSEPVRFDAEARGAGTATVRMRVTLGANTDAFESSVPVSAAARLETSAAFGDTTGSATERLALPADVVPTVGGLHLSLSSTALAGLGEGARYLIDYPYFCAEQKASSALALVLAAELGEAFGMGRIAPADYRARATTLLNDLPRYQCADGGFGYWPGGCLVGQLYLTGYVLHVMKTTSAYGYAPDPDVVQRALDFLDAELRQSEPRQVQFLPGWSAGAAFAVKVLTDYGRNEDSNITRLLTNIDRLPVFSLSYLADAIASSGNRAQRYDEVVRRLTNALRVEGDRAHAEELDDDALWWLWNSNVRGTSVVLEGFVRRTDAAAFPQRMARWLLAARVNGRWRNTQENATALEALVAYYRRLEADVPDMTGTVTIGATTVQTARFQGRSSTPAEVTVAMPDLLQQVAAGAEQSLTVTRAGTGRLYYTARLQFEPAEPPPPSDQGIRVERRYEKFVEDGESPAATTFSAGDLIRVTLAVTLPVERRFVAVTDALPGGLEAVDGWFRTTASDLARQSSVQNTDASWEDRWRRGGFDHVEKYDDRVVLFATRLSEGRHEFSYLVRATTSGTFTAAGTRAEEMYAPEANGRAAPATIVIR